MNAPLVATDLYQLTMIEAYLEHGLTESASFEFFVRKLPRQRNFLLAAGLETVLDDLESLRVSEAEIDWLRRDGRFSERLIDWLQNFHFSGNIEAMPEGTACFADEPILRVTAPLPMAQLVETRIINLLHFQTLIASKAVRMRLAAPEALLVDFGLRRTHGLESGLLAARAAFIAGLDGTSDVEAGLRYDLPLYGTMAHSFVQAHDSERDAFLHFARSHPDNCMLLIDTYDTLQGAITVAEMASELEQQNIRIKGVRLDSGDLAELAKAVRSILDTAGLTETTIFASGNLDEFRVGEIVRKHAPINGFGIGTRMDTSSDKPYLDCAYKLQMYAGLPKRKTSEAKATLPGIKQVFREARHGTFLQDIITTAGSSQDGKPLLEPVMIYGQRLRPSPPLDEVREYARAQLTALPEELRRLSASPPYPVHISASLQALSAIMPDG